MSFFFQKIPKGNPIWGRKKSKIRDQPPRSHIAILELSAGSAGTDLRPGGSDPTFSRAGARMTYVAQGKLPQIILLYYYIII